MTLEENGQENNKQLRKDVRDTHTSTVGLWLTIGVLALLETCHQEKRFEEIKQMLRSQACQAIDCPLTHCVEDKGAKERFTFICK